MKNRIIFCACAGLLTTSPAFAGPFAGAHLRGQLATPSNASKILVADHSEVTAGDLTIKDAFTRPTLGGTAVAVGYVTIVNKGTSADRLVSVSSDISSTTEIHESKVVNGVMEMHQLPNGLPIPAGATVALKPGSYHIMFMGIKQPVKPGDMIHAVLAFSKAGKVDVAFPAAASPGTIAPSMGNMSGLGTIKMQ